MRKNELSEVKKSDIKSIEKMIAKARMELIDLKLSLNTGKLSNLKQVNSKKKDLSQMMTVLNQKRLLERLEKSNA